MAVWSPYRAVIFICSASFFFFSYANPKLSPPSNVLLSEGRPAWFSPQVIRLTASPLDSQKLHRRKIVNSQFSQAESEPGNKQFPVLAGSETSARSPSTLLFPETSKSSRLSHFWRERRSLTDLVNSPRISVWTLTAAVVLALCSAIFSGLTLGMMMLDVVQLRVLMTAAEKCPSDLRARRDAIRAKKIYALRKDGNLLLVTLVVGNISVNSAFSILTSGLTNGVVGFFLSTIILTVTGEIIPQALCARYNLAIGYYLCPFIRLMEVLLYIAVKPIAVALDCALGPDFGTQYTREQLKALLGHHEKVVKLLNMDEARILFGGLDVAQKTVASAMTPLNRVFGLNADEVLNFNTAARMVVSGYSRIPVFDRSQKQCIIGVLYVKDLALIDPALRLPVRSALTMFGRAAYAVDVDVTLLDVLREFKEGRSHIAVVRRAVQDPGGGDPYYCHIGIITLEDVIEEILQDEIRDEDDHEGKINGDVSIEPRKQIHNATVDSTTHCSAESSRKKRTVCWNRWKCSSCSCCKKKKLQVETTSAEAGTSSSCPVTNSDTTTMLGPRTTSRCVSQTDATFLVNLRQQPCETDVETQASASISRRPRKSRVLVELAAGALSTDRLDCSCSALLHSAEAQKPNGVHSELSAMNGAPTTSSDGSSHHDPVRLSEAMTSDNPHQLLTQGFFDKPLQQPYPQFTSASKSPFLSSKSARVQAMLGRLQLFDRRRELEPLSYNEAFAVSLFLSATQAAFHPRFVNPVILQQLLQSIPVVEPVKQLFTQGVPANYLVLILQGHIRVLCGTENIECILGPWRILGAKTLDIPNLPELLDEIPLIALNRHRSNLSPSSQEAVGLLDQRLQQWAETAVYVPDFTAYPSSCSWLKPEFLNNLIEHTDSPANVAPAEAPLRCILLSRKFYVKALRGTLLEEAPASAKLTAL